MTRLSDLKIVTKITIPLLLVAAVAQAFDRAGLPRNGGEGGESSGPFPGTPGSRSD